MKKDRLYLLENQETARLYFRRTDDSYFDQWLELFNDPSSFKHWEGNYEKPTVECRKWFDRQAERYNNDEGGMNALIEKQSGKLIGFSGLLAQTVDQRSELEVAYSLLQSYWNKGLASEAAKKCIDFAFENSLAESLISIISLSNTPSANVALKNGMRAEKKTVYKENPVNIFRIYKSS